MQRKAGGYRKPTEEQRRLSMIPKDKFDKWFQQFWTITGASTKEHPAPYPFELASRLVQMFSFTGDTVLDPFCGTATTMVAALKHGRNSIGVELDTDYCKMAASRLMNENTSLFGNAQLQIELKPHHSLPHSTLNSQPSTCMAMQETPPAYKTRARKKTSGGRS
jgi:site-specific DNA-methyltransferase (adenine-specific)